MYCLWLKDCFLALSGAINNKLLAGKRRTIEDNKSLGRSLAFIAGAINAGGFLVVHQYTSHMTGILSLLVDNIALYEWASALAMLGYILCFISGAVTTTMLILWAKHRHLHCRYALPLAIEAMLLVLFGVLGDHYMQHSSVTLSYLIALLCYLMGVQNAVITKISNTSIRTTHVTGIVTDIGIELGRICYGINNVESGRNKEKMSLHLSIFCMFLMGGVIGAYGFKYGGFLAVIPLAAYLLYMAFFPIQRDVSIRKYIRQRLQR